MKGFLIAAMQSGAGKTVTSCALMAALKKRGLRVRAFKSGPDYIDPMFHSRVLGIDSRNLDLFLQGKDGVCRSFAAAAYADAALVEGAMGYYDGLGGTAEASAWELASCLKIPAVLVLRPKGSGLTLAAQVRGMLDFRKESRIAALLLADCPARLADWLTPILTRETGLPVLGFLPPMEEARIGSRHLGLLTAKELTDFSARFDTLARQTEASIDLDALLAIAGETDCAMPGLSGCPAVCRIAVASDEAFCFAYADSLDALRREGAEIVVFSPLHDTVLPAADGLYLPGGYPELYAEALAENTAMRGEIREAVFSGLPTVAECGGFLYLQRSLEDTEGKSHPMCGVFPGRGYKTERLQRFGYLRLSAAEDSLLLRAGEKIPAHEFHYWDSTENGEALCARKADGSRAWRCGYVSTSLYAAFPHLHFDGKTPLAERFVKACEKRKASVT